MDKLDIIQSLPFRIGSSSFVPGCDRLSHRFLVWQFLQE